MTTGLAFLDAENFFLFFFSKDSPLVNLGGGGSSKRSGIGLFSMLLLESERLPPDPLSSEAALLLWEWL